MRILMINKYHHIVGGADRYYFLLSKILSDRGHEVIAFSTRHPKNFPSKHEAYFVENSLTYQNYLTAGLHLQARAFCDGVYNWQAREKIEALIAATKPEVAHVHNIFYQLSPSIFEPLRRHGVPVVQTLHDYQPVCANNKFLANGKICEACKDSLFSIIRKRCYNNNAKTSALAFVSKVIHRTLGLYENRVDRFIAPSIFLRDKLLEHGMPAQKIVHIPYTIDEPQKSFARPGPWGNTVLYLGRLSRHKGVHTLIEAMAPLRALRLQIAGQGDAMDDLKRIIGERQLHHIELLDFLTPAACSEALANASLVVVPSEWYENSPMVIYEALAAGRPVLGARIGGIPELLAPEFGELFEPGNVLDLRHKIESLMLQPGRLQQMGARARLHAYQHFNVEQHYQRMMSLYHQLIAAKNLNQYGCKNRHTRVDSSSRITEVTDDDRMAEAHEC
ncbi:MAG: glycosyltransferase family 4 protein [candidate division KSB1 bacterium]|nr:glycosyltransferase family 4 protein [candidate division KSB1 bacterium]MDZ7301496.1 glycosyltransferase family 4 protein [candidate division KSB1 bacterium]MDZ7310898.1 glycosyltransferase family 4 protein [candidate division KSB1 bacterium]